MNNFFIWKSKFYKLKLAIGRNDFEKFRKLISNLSQKEWYRYGLTLLRQTILQNRKDMFIYMLDHYDLAVLETLQEEKMLLEYSIESRNEAKNEFICALLCYGADPFIKSHEGYNAFELAVINNSSEFIQEILFYYTFDGVETSTIRIDVLLTLALKESVFFHKVANFKITSLQNINGRQLAMTIYNLFRVHINYLKILLDNRYCVHKLCIIMKKAQELLNSIEFWPNQKRRYWRWYDNNTINIILLHDFIESDQILVQMSLIFQCNENLHIHMVQFISSLDSLGISIRIFESSVCSEKFVTECLIFMFEHGLKCHVTLLHLVFSNYGFCFLFKFLLSLEMEDDARSHCYVSNAIVNFICDPLLDVTLFLDKSKCFLKMDDCPKLLHYFADSRLRDLLQAENEICQPQVPLLVEIARNVFRKYLWKKLKVTSIKQFFSIVNSLPISATEMKIITLETALY